MPNSRFYSSIAAVTNLQVTANPGDTSIQVASSSGWPGTFPFIISLDYGAANEELALVTAGGPTNFTVTRAYDGTSSTTHNAGAVVRHVSSAIDFTDSRTHEASASGVHGITGSFVDTLSVQNVANKTLTSATIPGPAISTPTITGGGSLAGTFSGTPTLSGLVTFAGGLQVSSNSILVERAAVADNAYRARIAGDVNSRYLVNGDGKTGWGPGTTATDTNLYRSAVNTLKTDSDFVVGGGATITGTVSFGGITGVGQTLFARKPSDTNRTSTVTLTNDPHLTVTLDASATYTFDAFLAYNSGTTADFNMTWAVPAGATGSWSGLGWGRGAPATVGLDGYTIRTNNNDIVQARSYGGDSSDATIHVKGSVTTTSGGTFALQWAQAASDPGSTILIAGSYISLRRVV